MYYFIRPSHRLLILLVFFVFFVLCQAKDIKQSKHTISEDSFEAALASFLAVDESINKRQLAANDLIIADKPGVINVLCEAIEKEPRLVTDEIIVYFEKKYPKVASTPLHLRRKRVLKSNKFDQIKDCFFPIFAGEKYFIRVAKLKKIAKKKALAKKSSPPPKKKLRKNNCFAYSRKGLSLSLAKKMGPKKVAILFEKIDFKLRSHALDDSDATRFLINAYRRYYKKAWKISRIKNFMKRGLDQSGCALFAIVKNFKREYPKKPLLSYSFSRVFAISRLEAQYLLY